MMKHRARIALGLCALLVLLPSGPAHADCYQKLIEVNCATSLDYFSLRTFGSYGLPCPVDQTVNEDGIYSIRQVSEEPLVCVLEDQVIEFNIDFYKPALPRGACGGEENASAKLSVNGDPVLSLRTTHGWCRSGSFNHIIQVEGRTVRHCTIEHDDVTDSIPFGPPLEQQSPDRTAACTGHWLEAR